MRLKKEERNIVIEITDNGPGIPGKILRKIFDPFYTTKGAEAGTGLGLSISYFIITEQHKGSLEVSSPPGKGTKFTIRLPEKSSYCELDLENADTMGKEKARTARKDIRLFQPQGLLQTFTTA